MGEHGLEAPGTYCKQQGRLLGGGAACGTGLSCRARSATETLLTDLESEPFRTLYAPVQHRAPRGVVHSGLCLRSPRGYFLDVGAITTSSSTRRIAWNGISDVPESPSIRCGSSKRGIASIDPKRNSSPFSFRTSPIKPPSFTCSRTIRSSRCPMRTSLAPWELRTKREQCRPSPSMTC